MKISEDCVETEVTQSLEEVVIISWKMTKNAQNPEKFDPDLWQVETCSQCNKGPRQNQSLTFQKIVLFSSMTLQPG